MAFDTVIDQIKAVRGDTEIVIVKLGDVTGLSNGRAQVRIYGDSDTSNKLYHYIAGYIPKVGDKVALLPQGKTYIIIGRVTDEKPEEIYARKEWVEEKYLPDDYINVLEQGDGETLTFTNDELVPKTTNKHSLGSDSKYFKNLYIKKLVLDGAEYTIIDRIIVKNGGATYSLTATYASNKVTLTPSNDDQWILGTSTKQLAEAWIKVFRGSWKSGQATERAVAWDSNNALVPDANNSIDLGSSSYIFKQLFLDALVGAKYQYQSGSANNIAWDNDSELIPNNTNAVSLGSLTKQFNKIYAKEFYINGTLINGGTSKLTVTVGSNTYEITLSVKNQGSSSQYAELEPSTSNIIDLGDSSKKFRNIYATTIYGYLDGAIKDGGQEIKFDSSHNLNPSTTNYISLGTSNKQYKNVYGQNLYVNGSAASSDRNLKEEIEPLEGKHVEFFKNLKPVSYKFKDGTSGRRHTGFIAQEVEEAIEEAGMTDKDMAAVVKDESQYYLRYEEIIAVQTKVIQDLMARVEKLEAKVNRLEVERSRT